MSSKALVGIPSLCSKIVGLFPQKFSFCFAYGSGVFKQSRSGDQSKNVIDIIFSVDNPSEWHRENIEKNKKHYSVLGRFGHTAVARYQENWGAKVYFNTLVPIEEENALIKYGVISHSALVTDLLDWNHLYIAGRLHKPVEIIRNASDSELRSALQQNLHSVVHAALILLPDAFTEKKLYETIAGISYFGDFRMIFGEDKNKIENIVVPQINAFWDLYAPVLKSMSDYVDVRHSNDGHQMCYQNFSPTARHYHLNQLPRTPQRAIVRAWNRGGVKCRQDTEDSLNAMAFDPDCGEILDECIRHIVWSSSLTQSIKGILTAGLFKSVRYSAKKILKMYKSL